MMAVIDTSVLIDLERQNPSTIRFFSELRKNHGQRPHITFINSFEFLYGLKDKNISNQEKLKTWLERFPVLHTSSQTSTLLAKLKAKYDKKGIALPLADLLIACLVIENAMLLITKDKDFASIDELEKIIIKS